MSQLTFKGTHFPKMGTDLRGLQHTWDIPPKDAIQLQKTLAAKVVTSNQFEQISTVCGIDVSPNNNRVVVAAVVFSYPDLALCERTVAECPVPYPYVPGLLSFREGPATIKAVDQLRIKPDLLIFDGQGIAHPRRFGLASHIGVLLDIPSIGCAKTRLCGHYQDPSAKAGGFSLLKEDKDTIGAVVRTRDNVKPVFVSIGHRLALETCIEIILASCRGFRLPEPVRQAHLLAGKSLTTLIKQSSPQRIQR